MAFEALDGPSKTFKMSGVTTTTPIEVYASVAAFDERKVITLQGNGKFYVYFADEGETPSAGTISDNGFVQYKDAKETYEAAQTQSVFVLAVSGTVDIRAAERA